MAEDGGYSFAMSRGAPKSAAVCANEPWGRRLWLGVVGVAVVTACLTSYGIRSWPMADDEVPSLVEMGLFHVDPAAFSVPETQLGRLAKANIVWYSLQRRILSLLPHNELYFRVSSVICAVLTSAIAFLLGARWRGLWYATALAMVISGSQMFVYLSQLNRFYSLPLLLLTLTLAVVCLPRGGIVVILVTAFLTVLTVLSHNMTVAVFVLAFAVTFLGYVAGRVRLQLFLRSGTTVLVSVLLYVFYLRPIIHGWASTGNPTPVLVSFAAHASVPVLALALFGGWLSLVRRDLGEPMLWWLLLFAGSLWLFQVAPVSWNPRYFVFFMPALWVLAAYAVDFVARSVGYGSVGTAWYCCVAVLLLPSLLSHYQDGSRHNYREAAAVLRRDAEAGQPILSDDAETISYYLPMGLRKHLQVRTKVREFPRSEFFLVARSNAWSALPQIHDRQMDLLAQISRRRFDQFSHILRVYRVMAARH
jgi:hypothetical protein